MSTTPPVSRPRSGIGRAMAPLNTVVERFIPSALVFAIVLTVVVMAGALALTDAGPLDATELEITLNGTLLERGPLWGFGSPEAIAGLTSVADPGGGVTTIFFAATSP